MYEYTDKIMEAVNRKVVREFGKLKRSILSFDEINAVRTSVNRCYKAVLKEVVAAYIKIAIYYYKKAGGDTKDMAVVIENILGGYNPVTKYIFDTEWDRKRSRAFESIVATKSYAEIDKAERILSRQIAQFADESTDTATLLGYEDSDIDFVQWVAKLDNRVCEECRDRNGNIYPVTKVPPKPHPRCRCEFKPIR